MKNSAGLRVVAGLAVLLLSARGDAAELKLRGEVRTQKSLLTLGDLADIYAAEPQEAKSLAAVELMPAPASGNRQFVRLRDIQDLLAIRGVNMAELQFTGAGQVLVISVAESASKAAARRPAKVLQLQAQRLATTAIVAHLRELASEDEDWNVTVELESSQVQPIAAATEPIAAEGGKSPWLGSQRFRLTVPTANGPMRMDVAARVTLPPAVVVAVHAVPRGTVVRACDVELQRLTSDAAPGNAFQNIAEVAGQEAARNITPGQTLDANLVHPPLLVRAGEVVTVFGRNGAIVVRMPARAHENGAHGDLVTVESLLDRKTFLARVAALHEVEVFAGATATAPDVTSGNRRAAQASAPAGEAAE